jgi:hypothetical protein
MVVHRYSFAPMSLPIVLQSPDLVREEMNSMPEGVRGLGEKYLANGRVQNLRAGPDEGEFLAEVQDAESCQVRVVFDSEDTVKSSCSCQPEGNCPHIYAVLKALLVEHTQGKVRALSEAPRNHLAAGRDSTGKSSSFPEQVADSLGRDLAPAEKLFLGRLTALHSQCQQRGHITAWDFQELGLSLGGGYSWDPLKIWPAVPETLRRFWLYLARELLRRGKVFPEFLQPITDVGEIEAEVQRWQRAQEITKWKTALDTAVNRVMELAPDDPVQMIDLRLVMRERSAELEWRPAEQAEFSALNVSQLRDLQRRLRSGGAELMADAEWLWAPFEQKAASQGKAVLEFYEESTQRTLSRLFRLPVVRARLVNQRGEVLQFVKEPLRWEATEPEDAHGDYVLRLTKADGSSPGRLLLVLGDRASLYVTETEVFPGPTNHATVLDPRAENKIPAAAMESDAGMALLHMLGMPMPKRLARRVQVVPLRMELVCELKPTYPGAKTEHCSILPRALDESGAVIETWNGNSWVREDKTSATASKKNGVIRVSDRRMLANPPALLAGLDAKWEMFRGGFTVRVTKKFPDLFSAWLKSLPPHIKVDLKGDLASLTGEVIAGRVKLDVSEADIDWFDLRVVLDVDDTTLSQAELKLLLNARGGFVRLEGKGWKRLKFDISDEEDEQLARLGLNPRELTAEPQRLHALQLSDKAAKKFLAAPQYEQIERRASEIKTRVTPDVPATIRAELRPYQRDGFHFLAYLSANRFGGILADDMGLGKTLQTLAWLEHLRMQAPSGPGDKSRSCSLVVCPKSVMDNWRAEAGRFVTGLRVKTWGAGDVKDLLNELGEADLHVINYNQLRLIGESLSSVHWLAVILDEGQYIKNPGSVTAMIARGLHAAHRLVLSGTPIENRLMDLWSLMTFAMPGAIGNRAQFVKMFDAKDDPLARRRLAARVRPFLLRRTKSQVAKDLPDRMEEDLFCEIEGEQKTLYRAELKRAQQMLLGVQTQKQLAEQRFHFLTSLLRLRQICCHPKLVKPDSKAVSAKIEALIDQVEPLMEEGHKVLIFSQFVEMLEILRAEINARRWPLFYLAGSTQNRGELVQQFQAAEGAAVFLISLKAGGFGLNLTAASYVVLFDPWWNPAVENQAIDRTHRIGQTRNVIAYRLLIKDSIEEKIRTLQKQKSALAEDVLGEEKFSQSLSLDDLRYLFSGDVSTE